ncbi:anaerobic glycerol-3-phosphate dehydrogenase subunit A [Bacillus sp. ISL-40]|uniref:anaerobic glycerol-3-phosphate dehydrogenase subunit GlpA n=1 Tax=unclassified Bacillus (in: firmicutes) TaxID=185979 RepID=UPI001BE8AABD|nr:MULTISPECIES: anaerobic glycerol-3-phosphate dehydrogenase subunit GlpA [unclassified Bacillus (in: firmicutes)]MBT2699614.1 anaerobic glycerol-3-phosphate dehydrogenase subunit A [Bacillus sp. ISL-40]MBT2724166.1 anaerobic glycerol-3-phosphate dehydrogenase subunit A [Bacillus sp. ISL-46]
MGQKLETEVIVIGGGMTGAGVLRDLSLRDIKAILIEQQDLGHGTSTRNHGLLHSGARYAVRDEEAAIESYRENLILKKTIPGSIEQTGGLFVKVPEDDVQYIQKWLASCEKVGIPVEEIPVAHALQQEPFLNKDVQAVYRVPDGAVDCFTMVVDVVADAVKHGAKALTYHEVVDVLTEQHRVIGVQVCDVFTGEKKEIFAQLVVNAAGPWGAEIAQLAGIPLRMINNKGMLAIFSHRINKQVINRLRMPGDADIFVPAHNVTIFGTTGMNVEDPNDFSLNRQELEGMLAEGKKLIPKINELRLIRAFSGSRPLYQESNVADASGRNVTRGVALLDHHTRDGLDGLVTITGGKLTTFRFMAEKTVDLICEKLGVRANCTTDQEMVPHRNADEFFKEVDMAPAAKQKLFHWAGTKAKKIESALKEKHSNVVVCECEQVTWAEIESVLPEEGRFHLGDIRRRTRLGMGPCQGTFCNHRAAALAVEKGKTTIEEAGWALHHAVFERKKGMDVVATGETAKQLQLMETIYKVSLGLGEGDYQHV